ncbi:MAG: beta strand repeat-containing protein [Candidatus Sumerlaeaceae bacterium]
MNLRLKCRQRIHGTVLGIVLGFSLGSAQSQVPQVAARQIGSGSSPASESWQTIRSRDAVKEARRQDEIRRGLRPPLGIPHVQPEEHEKEEDELRPGRDSGPSTAPLERPRFRLSLPEAQPQAPQALSGAGFKGDDMLEGSQASGFLFIPPDTQGAIGPNHFVEMTNATVSVFTRAGVKLTTASLDSFFTLTVSGTTYPRNGSTDPRVIYDRRSGRWFACIIEIGASSSGAANNIILAVSRTSDAITTVWDKYLIPTAQGGATGNTKFNDYESLGLDDNGVYFGMRVFTKSGSHARIVVTPKSPLIAASPSLGAVSDFDLITDMYSTPQPGNNYDAVTSTSRVWFVAANHQFYANMNYRRVTWSGATASIDAASTVLTTPAFAAPLDVPTLNASLDADVGDMRMMMAVIRNNRLWCCRHVGVNASGGSTSANRTACEFLELDVSTANATLVQSGRVFDTAATAARYYFYPSLAVSGQGHVAMGMSGAKSTEFIGAWTAGRFASDPSGTMGAPLQFKAGDAKYSVSFGGSPNRWGDYSFTSLDPNDDMSIWTIQEYARTPSGSQDLWSTWIVKELSAAPTLNNPAASGLQGTSNYNLALTGTGFYDPGAGFPNRLAVALNGGAINGISGYAVTYNSPTSANVMFNIAGNASVGTRDIVLTNPDGQTATVLGGFTVNAGAPNTAPVVTVPGAQNGSEDTNLVLSGISVADADSGAGELQTTLTVTNGKLTLSSTAGLTFTGGTSNNSAVVAFTGTLANTNAALNNLTYLGNLNYSGSDSLNVAVDDRGNSGSGGALADSENVSITLAAINDAPVVASPSSASGSEDANLALPGISVSDVDLGANPVQLALGVSNGTLTLGSVTGLSFTAGANSTAAMTFNGSLANVNAALATLSYQPTSNYSGSDSVAITANDLGATGSGGAQSDAESVPITISAINDAPVLSVPASSSGNEDASIAISGISVADADLGTSPAQATLGVTNGVLNLGSTVGLGFTSGANGTSTMTFSGSLANVNSALSGLSYLANLNYNGSDTLSITISDLGGNGSGGMLTDVDSIPITIAAINDPPIIAAPASASGNEDTSISIVGVSFTDADIAAGNLRISLGATSGNLKLGSVAGLTFLFGNDNSTTMTFTASIAAANTAVTGLVYSPPANFNGGDSITVSAGDQGQTGSGGALTDSETIPVTVTAVNDAPVLTAPGAQNVNEDTTFTLPAITLSDTDLGAGSIQVTLSCTNGNIGLPSTIGLAFSSGANGTASMIFSGSPANVSTALNAITYRGASNFSGGDTLSVIANDLGNTGSGGAKTDSKSVPITVNAINDAPVLSAPPSANGNEDTSITIAGISAADPDIGAASLHVTLAVSSGTLKLASVSGLSFLTGADGTSAMVFTGTVTSVNSALNGLAYSANLNYSGVDSLALTISDQGNTGSGGAGLASTSIPISIQSVNDAPVVTVPGAQGVLHDTPLVINGTAASDVDLGAGELQITLSANNGKLTLNSTAGLTFSTGDGTGDALIVFTGALSAINNALSSLTYLGNTGYSGPDTVSVTANDQGFTGSGGLQSDLKTISINVAVPVGISELITD